MRTRSSLTGLPHHTHHTIPSFPAGYFSSESLTPPLSFASDPPIVCQDRTGDAPWLDFRIPVQPGVLGWDLNEDPVGLVLYESSPQRPRRQTTLHPALSLPAASAHRRLKQHHQQQLIWNILARSLFHDRERPLPQRARKRESDRQMDRERGVLQTVRMNMDLRHLRREGGPWQSEPMLPELGIDRQRLPLGIRVGSFSCDALKHVSIPGHCQPPPNDLRGGVRSKLSPPWAVPREILGKSRQKCLIHSSPYTLEDQGVDKLICYKF